MTTEELMDVIKAVAYINEKFMSQAGDFHQLGFVSNGREHFVFLLGQEIWSSENDDRWEDENGSKDPFIPHLFHEVQAELAKFNSIQFYEAGDVRTCDIDVLYNQ